MLIPAPSHEQCCRETASAIIKSNPTTPTKGAGAYHNGARFAKAPPLPFLCFIKYDLYYLAMNCQGKVGQSQTHTSPLLMYRFEQTPVTSGRRVAQVGSQGRHTAVRRDGVWECDACATGDWLGRESAFCVFFEYKNSGHVQKPSCRS
jgi:hypothetical protein